MHRFFIPGEWIKQEEVTLQGERAHQAAHVLRLKAGEHIMVLDNTGWEYEVALDRVTGDLVRGVVVNKALCPGEPGIRITLCQAILKSDKFELVLQKGVELGVSAFVPFISERCVAGMPAAGKVRRWQEIVREATEQSGRGLLPALYPAVSFADACRQAVKPAILLWEEENRTHLNAVIRSGACAGAGALSIFIGPEGGLPPAEAAFAGSCGITPVTIGRRVLRAETAGIAAISAVLYEKGELG